MGRQKMPVILAFEARMLEMSSHKCSLQLNNQRCSWDYIWEIARALDTNHPDLSQLLSGIKQ